MTNQEVDALVDALVPEIKAFIEKKQAPLVASVDALLAITAELERRLAAVGGEK